MLFRNVFIAIFIGAALVVAALLVNHQRPTIEVQQPSAEFVRASGKCAECHLRETAAVVHQYSLSRHASVNMNCIDCHRPVEGQQGIEHRGFTIAKSLTAANCRQCHPTEYDQFVRSRHGAPAWAAVTGADYVAPESAHASRRSSWTTTASGSS